MSDWGWVSFAYAVTYAGMAAYVGFLAYRLRNARRRLQELQ